MPRPYKPLIPQDVGEILDKLEWMGYAAPTFKDKSIDMMWPGRDLGVVFFELSEGLGVVQKKLGEERYRTLMEMSDRMRALFEADPEDTTGQAQEGRKLIEEMRELMRTRRNNAGGKSSVTD